MAPKKKSKNRGPDEMPDVPAKMPRKEFEHQLRTLQVELCHLQAWVQKKGLRVIVVFEGRDAAGKGGVIKRITERVSPRVFRVVALPAPSDRQKSQLYLSDTWSTFRRRVRSCCSIAAGTTGRASSG
jgi:polyphosphate kinase 2 (PPK2 family)